MTRPLTKEVARIRQFLEEEEELTATDQYYNGPSVDDSHSYYHKNQIEAHKKAIKAGAYANSVSKNSGNINTAVQAHLQAASDHEEAWTQLGSFGGAKQHKDAAKRHRLKAKQLKSSVSR